MCAVGRLDFMQRRTKFGILLLFMAFAVAIGTLALKSRQPESSYLGKPESYWLNDGFSIPRDIDGRRPAESAFRCMGSNAVPFLIAALGQTDGPLKHFYSRCYPQLPVKVRKKLPRPTSADELRGRAIIALTLIGPTAKPALPSLLNVLAKDTNAFRRANAVVCLDAVDNGNYQEEVVDAWLRARSDPDPWVARAATGVLRRRFPLGVFRIDFHEMSLPREGFDINEKVYKK
jgi:hypothetical protein